MHSLLRGDGLGVVAGSRSRVLQAALEQLSSGCSGACTVKVTGYQASGAMGEPGCCLGRTLIVKLAARVQMSWKFSFISSTDQAFA